jgi:hypothetical protein
VEAVRRLSLAKIAISFRAAKEPADERVVRSLYHRAIGYSYDSEEIFVINGKIKRVPVRKHVPPNVTAGIFWIKNRRPDLWRDRHEIAHKLPPRTDKSIAELRDELLQDMVEAGLVTLLPAPEPAPEAPAGVANKRSNWR